MQDNDLTMLHDAIERNASVVLSLPSAGILRHCKSRFLQQSDEGFWMEGAPDQMPLIQELIQSRVAAGVSFKTAEMRGVFTTPIIRHCPDYHLNDQTTVDALLLQMPTAIKTLQRRENYRVGISSGAELSLRMWRIGPGVYIKDRPPSASEVSVQLRDLSVGGLGATLSPRNGEPLRLSEEDRLRIELVHEQGKLLLEGHLCYPTTIPPDADRVRIGVQFKPLENDLEGRKSLARLTRLVGDLQRQEVRRYCLGTN